MSKRAKTKTAVPAELEALVNSIKTPEELEELTRQLRQKTLEINIKGYHGYHGHPQAH